ncbi:zinc-binding dehydrogenase [Candidatus Woesearchaeota archaeon]|nr:zinc-binding dehydrogenase [Candidatus Woesearchaeota archaeon]
MNHRVMKAAVLAELYKPLEIMELVVPSPSPGLVLVKVMASGLCNSQLLEIIGKNATGSHTPNLLGHEGAGIVEEVGEGVTKVKKGDHVVLSWIKGSGAHVLPPKYRTPNGQEINAGYVTTFNEYCLASENRVTPIQKEMPFLEAALIGCAVPTGAGAVLNNAKVKKGQSVMVVGAGGIGMNMIHAASLSQAHPIIAVDLYDHKLELAKQFGATHTINSSMYGHKEIMAIVKSLVGEEGLDYAFDTSGVKQLMEMAYDIVKKLSGRAVLCGKPKENIEIDPFPLFYGRQLVGTGGGETNPDTDFKMFCEKYLQGTYKLKEMISHAISLEEINYGFDLMKKGDCTRVVIDFMKKKA